MKLVNIPTNINYVIHTLQAAGFKAYVVGGCVRDSLLNREPNDWDICTSASPEKVMEIFENTIPTGIKHGTVTIMQDNEPIEVTTFRKDGEYTDGRHPDNVIFCKDIYDDLYRRDFTINSMAYNDEEGLIDPFNGINDINNKIIRCVGNPIDRFNEDALRMLRAVRFSAQLGFNIEDSVISAMKQLNSSIMNVSMERIRSEFIKTITSDSNKIRILVDTGLIKYFIPEIESIVGFNQNNPYHHLDLYEHTLKSTQLMINKAYLKLVMLFHDLGKIKTQTTDENGISHYYGHAKESMVIAKDILTRLKFDNVTINNIVTLIKYHDYQFNCKKSIKTILNKIGEPLLHDLILVRECDIRSQRESDIEIRVEKLKKSIVLIDEVLSSKECFSVKNLEINGNDLIQLGFKQGKEIGVILNELLELVIETPKLNTKEQLIKIVKGR